jgi:hypothetical protein
MGKVTLDASFQTKLANLAGQVELCDESGQTVGYFLSVAEYERLQQLEAEYERFLYAKAQNLFADEELDQAEQESEEYTTHELLQHLEQL